MKSQLTATNPYQRKIPDTLKAYRTKIDKGDGRDRVFEFVYYYLYEHLRYKCKTHRL